jgi:2,4-dienoyl-CoA reductase-like NADH-dependent reductase (Old Yellow Enzyme family)/thioredoxin reductase
VVLFHTVNSRPRGERRTNMASKFEKMLTPGTIGKLQIRNRIVMPPMVRNYATPEGLVTKRLVDHYATIARGGVGFVIVEATNITPQGKGFYQELGICADGSITGLSFLAESIKEWGAKVAIQLHHSGRQTTSSVTGMEVVAPSAIPCPVQLEVPRELTTREVADMVEAHVCAVTRAKAAGFDAVEIHGAHGYIVDQFLSAATNRRTDKYGGDLDERMTFALEIIKRVKEEAGADFPVVVRINGDDFVEGGLTIGDAKKIAQKLVAAGVDALHVTGGMYETLLNPRVTSAFGLSSMYVPGGALVGLAEEIKKVVSVPVITVGGISPEMGEEILQKGRADFIAIGRGLLVDPQLPNKLTRGDAEDIRRCIRCNEGCIGRLFDQKEVRCAVNAEVGYEGEGLRSAQPRKKVFVVGGGIAGMEAARVASLRGHEVSLWEKSDQLGGHLVESSVPEFKADIRPYKDWLASQVHKLGVKVEMGKEATAKSVEEAKPDAVVVATGSCCLMTDVPGLDKPHVATAMDVLLGKAKVGNKVIVIGGGLIGSETAAYLAQQGKKTTIVEMLPEIAADVTLMSKGALMTLLMDSQVEMLTDLRISEITDKGVLAVDKEYNIRSIEGDTVVIAWGLSPETALYEELKGKVPELYTVGDCVEPRKIGEATRDGYRVGAVI